METNPKGMLSQYILIKLRMEALNNLGAFIFLLEK